MLKKKEKYEGKCFFVFFFFLLFLAVWNTCLKYMFYSLQYEIHVFIQSLPPFSFWWSYTFCCVFIPFRLQSSRLIVSWASYWVIFSFVFSYFYFFCFVFWRWICCLLQKLQGPMVKKRKIWGIMVFVFFVLFFLQYEIYMSLLKFRTQSQGGIIFLRRGKSKIPKV